MNLLRYILQLILITTITLTASAQGDIPIGTWRAHLSFKQIKSLALTSTHVYAASSMGILVLDREDNSLSSLNKLNGLSSSGISAITYDTKSETLIVMYEDGNLDLVREGSVTNITTLRDANIIGSKRINHASVRNSVAYISTDYGIAILDLSIREIRETWMDLGESGKRLKINNTLISGDSIFAATNNGIISGHLSDNLLDFHFWRHMNEGEFAKNVKRITSFNGDLYAAIDTTGIFRKAGNQFENLDLLTNETFNAITGSEEGLLIVTSNALWTFDGSNNLVQIPNEKIQRPVDVVAENSTYWIGDLSQGLLSNANGTFQQFLSNGPTVEGVTRLRFTGENLFALPAASSTNDQGDMQEVNIFRNGLWHVEDLPITRITDVVVTPTGTRYFSSFNKGLLQASNEGQVIFNQTNSPLKENPLIEEGVRVPAILGFRNDLWILNYGVQPFLHRLQGDGTWTSFTSTSFSSQYALDLVLDDFGYIWLRIDPTRGGGLVVFDPKTSGSNVRNNNIGSGGLLNNSVLSLAVDRNSNVWAGTAGGLGYFYAPDEDAVSPIFEGRFLLRDERITDIEIDGGNRKWVGTENGAWLFDPTGEILIHHFNEENSPLLSNIIHDIEIHPASGEIFFATDKGIISYRGDATNSEYEFTNVKIFPNPVTAQFTGNVGIEGLATDAIVKITDLSGKLVWQGRANGGTASWSLRSYNGNRVTSGMYLVFAATEDGSDAIVGKIAVID